ncbi:acyltransferase family protein [Desulfovibrio sp. JC022]|uniref:acyltransferase family protein n=1 Tax=Desulfovibrio sp. JC022 TaxID=2593642 RepID=UPI0013D75A3D|nr:acyltransferase family protein [Desulfovibrio sp. JC022]NDV22152.1 acyltransferase [Desulfovibrio sp. JC022]
MSVIPYRKDIDGLRAVAVLLVVLSHAKIPFFEGGFVGVDVFFVISGFLITSIMVNEIDRGVFSFKTFYLRRIRRILPALIVVLGATSLAAHKMLMPNQLISYAKAQFASLTYWANYFFWRYYGGYWRGSSKEFPLTHTWSLSVEEQFYFIWPAVLLLAYTLIPKKFHKAILFTAFTAFFILSEYLVKFPEFAFYMIPARFYELFMGAMAALIIREPITLKSTWAKPVVVSTHLIGFGLILYANFFFKEGLPYPGINAFIPCLGTLLLLLPFDNNSSPVEKLFSSAPFVGVGKISYSLYLWHWPVFSLLAYSGHSFDTYRIPALLLSFGLSLISYFGIEQPLRKARMTFKAALTCFVLVPAMLSVFYLYGAIEDGYAGRYAGNTSKAVKAVSMVGSPYEGAQQGKGSPTDSHLENRKTIWNFNSTRPIEVLLVGDSHSTAIRPMVEMICNPFGYKGLQVSRDSTPFLSNVDFYDRDVHGNLVLRKDKRAMNNYWKKLVTEKKVKYVFIAAFYSSRIFSNLKSPELMVHDSLKRGENVEENNKRSFYLGLHDTVKFLIDQGVTPVIFKDIPCVNDRLSVNYVKNLLFDSKLKTSILWSDILDRHKFEDGVIDEIKEEYPHIIVIDPKKLLRILAEDGRFDPVLNGVPLYLDSNHLNRDGAIVLGKEWISRFGNPLTEN